MFRSCLPILFILIVLVAACGPEEPDRESGDTLAAEPSLPGNGMSDGLMEHSSECANQMYTVRFPSGWHVNPEDVLQPCSLFDPDSIDVPVASEIPIDIAVMIGVEQAPVELLAGDVLGRRDRSREEATVAGRPAVRIVGEATGEGLYDRGTRSYQYFVDVGDSTLVAATYDAGSLPFQRKRAILDAMVETLRLR